MSDQRDHGYQDYIIHIIPPGQGRSIAVRVTAPSDFEARRAAKAVVAGGRIIGIERA